MLRRGAILLLCALTIPSQGAVIQFFGEDLGPLDATSPRPNSAPARAAFLSNLAGVSTENFESFANGQAAPLPLTFGADTATLTGGSTINSHYPVSSAGRIPTSGRQYFTANNTFSIAFSSPQAAFGFYGSDIGDFSGQLTMTVNYAAGGSTTINIPHTLNSPSASLLFFGLIVTTNGELFSSLDFRTTTGNDIFGFDDMTIGRLEQVNEIPEPSTALLVSAAGAAVALMRARRRA
jgi:hypothetical protein